MAMVSFKFRVKYADGREVETATKPKDLIGFERHFGIPLADSHGSMEHLIWMAWVSLFNAGKEPRDFDNFLEVIDEVEQLEQEAPPADPTNADQSGD